MKSTRRAARSARGTRGRNRGSVGFELRQPGRHGRWRDEQHGAARVSLPDVLDLLGSREINELWVEAGPRLAGRCWIRTWLMSWSSMLAPKLLGPRARPLVETGELRQLDDARRNFTWSRPARSARICDCACGRGPGRGRGDRKRRLALVHGHRPGRRSGGEPRSACWRDTRIADRL